MFELDTLIATREAAKAAIMLLMQQNQDLQQRLDAANARIIALESGHYAPVPIYPYTPATQPTYDPCNPVYVTC